MKASLLPHSTLRNLLWACLLVAAIAIAIGLDIEVEEVHAWARDLNGAMVFCLLTVLPLIGFPVTVLHVTAGMRFGAGWGFALVALSILLQLIASYAIVKVLPDFFAKRLERARRRLPQTAHRPLTFFTLLLPGAPYAMQLYVLPLAGVPFHTVISCSLPVHVTRSVVGVSLGEFSDDPTPGRLAAIGLYIVMLVLAWAWSLRRLRARLAADPPPAAGDLTPPS